MRRLRDSAVHLRFAEKSLKAALDEGECDAARRVHVEKLKRGVAGARRLVQAMTREQ